MSTNNDHGHGNITSTDAIDAAFFYGTLMHPQILARVILGPYHSVSKELVRLQIQPAVLENHARHRVKGVDYPAVVAESGQCVQGTLVRGLTELDLMRLDAFEGNEYTRKLVLVGSTPTYTYVWTAPASMLDRQPWNYEDFIEEKLRNWIGAPETAKEYAESDALDQSQKADASKKAIKVGADVGGGSGGRSAFLS